MTHLTGLIEIEDDGYALGAREDLCGDTTLEELFNRLVRGSVLETSGASSPADSPTRVLTANLDALADDLDAATRDVLAEIFHSFGRR